MTPARNRTSAAGFILADAAEAARRREEQIRGMSDDVLAAAIRFLDCPQLSAHFSSYVHELRAEQNRRAARQQ